MKNLLVFMFGMGCGIGGTMLYLHKMIKNELKNMQISGNMSTNNDSEPFKMEDKEEKQQDTSRPVAMQQTTKIEYNKLIDQVEKGEKPIVGTPIRERGGSDDGGYFVEHDETDGCFVEIDKDEFIHNKDYEKQQLVYYQADHILATDNGTVLTRPAMMIGGEWEKCVGNYADRTAFIRNHRLVTDYEIYVDEGSYVEEYGPLDGD